MRTTRIKPPKFALRVDPKALGRQKEMLLRAGLLDHQVVGLEALDAADPRQWRDIVAVAIGAGIDKDEMCRALACAPSTVLRWQAGTTVPGPHARRGIKALLVEMLRAQARALPVAQAQRDKLQETVAAVAAETVAHR